MQLHRLALWGSVVLAAGAIGCDRDADSGPAPAGSVIPLPTGTDTASAARVYASSTALDLPRRPAGPRRLVFSGERLIRVDATGVELLQVQPLKQLKHMDLRGGRFGLTLKDGAFLGVGESQLLRIPDEHNPRAKDEVPEYTPRVSLFPGSQVFADRRAERNVWVQHPFDTSIYEYSVQPGAGVLLPMQQVIELEGYDQGAFTGLADGSFVFSSGRELRQLFPGGKAKALGSLGFDGKLWRILPTRRIDRAWLIPENGEVQLVELAGGQLRVVQKLPPVAPRASPSTPKPFDAISSSKYIARLLVDAGPKGRSWRLVVNELGGKLVLDETLPRDPRDDGKAYDDWIELATRNFDLALSDKPPFVGVGGPDRVVLWALPGGARQELLSRAPSQGATSAGGAAPTAGSAEPGSGAR